MIPWFWTILLPTSSHIAMTVMVRGRRDDRTYYEKVSELGLEVSILEVGITIIVWGLSPCVYLVNNFCAAALFLNILLVAVCRTVMESTKLSERLRATLCVIFSAVAFAGNTFCVVWVNNYGITAITVSSILAFGVPILLFFGLAEGSRSYLKL